jgi:hypothetical protein
LGFAGHLLGGLTSNNWSRRDLNSDFWLETDLCFALN